MRRNDEGEMSEDPMNQKLQFAHRHFIKHRERKVAILGAAPYFSMRFLKKIASGCFSSTFFLAFYHDFFPKRSIGRESESERKRERGNGFGKRFGLLYRFEGSKHRDNHVKMDRDEGNCNMRFMNYLLI